MNMVYQLHHAEQMEALRRDFSELWELELLPNLKTKNNREIIAAHQDAWKKFKEAKSRTQDNSH